MARATLLTGATGLLGRYLLRDLLAAGHRVAVLVRDAAGHTGAERVGELMAFGEEALRRHLPRPVILNGDLTAPGLGLGPAERRWLSDQAGSVVHSAAYVAYRPTPEGEPWRTNVEGTRRLLELCSRLGIHEVHHVSTAFLCGDRQGLVREDECDCGGGTANAYEQSKFAGEQLVRAFPGIHATVYRPSVIVGDSGTGYTSTYHHFYRFLELAVRLSAPAPGSARLRRQRLSVRLPLTGEETQNLVPVDWVAQSLVQLLRRPHCHGKTFHLVAGQPVLLREIKAIVEELLHLEGIRWAGPGGIPDPTPLERLVLEQFEDYWSYLHRNLRFDCTNTRRALPDLPPPVIDRALVDRLLRFAREDRWGREPIRRKPVPDCGHYLEQVLPEQARHSPLARALPHDLHFALDVRGPGGGQWTCRPAVGGGLSVSRGRDPDAAVVYRTDAATFDDLVRGRRPAQQAFFDGRIDIEGDLEKGLKLAAVIEQFLTDAPGRRPHPTEPRHAAAGS